MENGKYGTYITTSRIAQIADCLPVDGSLWLYAPNKGAPPVWAFLFAVSGCIHAWQCMYVNSNARHLPLLTVASHYKCWKVTGIFPWAALIFTAGYALREVGAFHYGNLNIYISSLVMLYAAP
jgi:hypothetical protein